MCAGETDSVRYCMLCAGEVNYMRYCMICVGETDYMRYCMMCAGETDYMRYCMICAGEADYVADYTKYNATYTAMLQAGQLPAGVVVVPVSDAGQQATSVALYGQPIGGHDGQTGATAPQYYGELQTVATADFQALTSEKGNRTKGKTPS